MSKKIIFTRDAKLSVKEFANVPADQKPSEGATIGTLSGYAIVWNVLSSDRGGYKVRLLPKSGRFTAPAHALYHHDFAGGPLGDTASGTLRVLPPDDYGQPVEIDLPNTTLGRDTLELVKSKRMKGMSFAMVEAPTSEEKTEGGETVLTVSDFLCDEVTVTAIPAFEETTIGVKVETAADQAQPDQAAESQQSLPEKKSDESTKERDEHSRKLHAYRLSAITLDT